MAAAPAPRASKEQLAAEAELGEVTEKAEGAEPSPKELSPNEVNEKAESAEPSPKPLSADEADEKAESAESSAKELSLDKADKKADSAVSSSTQLSPDEANEEADSAEPPPEELSPNEVDKKLDITVPSPKELSPDEADKKLDSTTSSPTELPADEAKLAERPKKAGGAVLALDDLLADEARRLFAEMTAKPDSTTELPVDEAKFDEADAKEWSVMPSPRQYLADEDKLNGMTATVYKRAGGGATVAKEAIMKAHEELRVEEGQKLTDAQKALFQAAAEACGVSPDGAVSLEEYRADMKIIFAKMVSMQEEAPQGQDQAQTNVEAPGAQGQALE